MCLHTCTHILASHTGSSDIEILNTTAEFPVLSSDGSIACAMISVVDDDVLEGDETLTVQLVSVTDNSGMGNPVNLGSTDLSGTITIADNEG